MTAVTDDAGKFLLTVAPGIYEIDVNKGGFNAASVRDTVATAGQAQSLAVVLSVADLSSLRTIGTVSNVAGTRSTINTTAATTSSVSQAAFSDLANPQIDDVLQRIPDVTIQHMGSQPDTTIIVGGLQPYETQVLLDGHPLALGQYGVWVSTYFPSYLIGGVETQSGPGNTTPFANLAVGGTANLLTPGYTKQSTLNFVSGVDNYQSQYSNLLATGSVGNLSYVLGGGAAGANGPYFSKQGCAFTADNYANDNTPQSAGIIEFCAPMGGSLFTRGLVGKLRYDFTPSTSLEVGFVGAWGGYSPQASAWGNSIGPTTVEQCLVSIPLECTNPAYANLIGKTVNGYVYYPGTFVYNNQDMFDAQFRTSIGNNTLLIRPYIGDIEPEIINGTGEEYYPYFFSPPGTTPSLAPGVQIPGSYNNTYLPNPNTFESTVCPPGNLYSYGQINSPNNTLVSVNGQEECFQYPYETFELDKLYGSTLSFIHPLGEGYLDFTYDFHGQSTFAYVNSPANVALPFSADRYSTFSLTGDLRYVRNLAIDFGLYATTWTLAGVQPELVGGSPVLDAFGNPVLVGLDRDTARFDPHIAFVFRPTSDLAYRFAYGSSATFPYVGQVSGVASFNPLNPSAPQYTGGILTEKNPSLLPEVSTAFSAGADKRFANGSVLSLDLQDMVVHDVFETLTLGIPTSIGQLEAVTQPINVARLRAQTATLKYAYAPHFGFGYNIAATADRSIADGLPASVYNGGPGFPVNDVQICGNGLSTPGIPTCVPYLKGYAQATYTWRNAGYLALGVDYEGKNNAYFQPPFAVADLTFQRPITSRIEFQLTIQNLLNTNAFTNLPEPNVGVPLVAGATNDGVTAFQTTYASTLIPAAPRTLRVQLRYHFGR